MGSFRHGVHPGEHKERTEALAIERMPFGKRYILPLAQHIGAPSLAVVGVGDTVRRGQLVAKPGSFVSTALHAPVTGTVVALEPRRHPFGHLADSLVIEADPFASQEILAVVEGGDFVPRVQAGGIVGLGGAAFPSHVKYAVPEGKKVTRLVINGAECEPYLTCDHRLMVERPEAVLRGIRLLAAHMGVERSTVGIEDNKPDAVAALRAALRPDDAIDVQPLHVKYPQGAEKMLIYALFGLTVPAGKLPLDLGIVVNNVGTMTALADWIDHGRPLVERALTVSGPGIPRPSNLMVPIGTPIRDVIEHCGGLADDTTLVVMGGPMMGQPLADLDTPVVKGTSGILALTDAESGLPEEYPCIRCGRCIEACAVFLNPSRLARMIKADRVGEAQQEHYLMDCMECGACSFACPSGIPIVQLIRSAKRDVRRLERRKKDGAA